jgi:small subunit ribosomal protein S7
MNKYKHTHVTDPELQRRVMRRFVGCLIKRGNRLVAERMFREIITALIDLGENPIVALLKAFQSIKPTVSLFSKRVGGTSYKLPVILTEEQSYTIAIHWLVKNALKRTEQTATQRILNEILLTLKENAPLVKRRNEIHTIALANRPFLRYK